VAFSAVCAERDVERVPGYLLAEFGAHSPASLAGAFDGAVYEVAGDEGQDHRVPLHHGALRVLGHQAGKLAS
jgi:hypothetical protein